MSIPLPPRNTLSRILVSPRDIHWPDYNNQRKSKVPFTAGDIIWYNKATGRKVRPQDVTVDQIKNGELDAYRMRDSIDDISYKHPKHAVYCFNAAFHQPNEIRWYDLDILRETLKGDSDHRDPINRVVLGPWNALNLRPVFEEIVEPRNLRSTVADPVRGEPARDICRNADPESLLRRDDDILEANAAYRAQFHDLQLSILIKESIDMDTTNLDGSYKYNLNVLVALANGIVQEEPFLVAYRGMLFDDKMYKSIIECTFDGLNRELIFDNDNTFAADGQVYRITKREQPPNISYSLQAAGIRHNLFSRMANNMDALPELPYRDEIMAEAIDERLNEICTNNEGLATQRARWHVYYGNLTQFLLGEHEDGVPIVFLDQVIDEEIPYVRLCKEVLQAAICANHRRRVQFIGNSRFVMEERGRERLFRMECLRAITHNDVLWNRYSFYEQQALF